MVFIFIYRTMVNAFCAFPFGDGISGFHSHCQRGGALYPLHLLPISANPCPWRGADVCPLHDGPLDISHSHPPEGQE